MRPRYLKQLSSLIFISSLAINCETSRHYTELTSIDPHGEKKATHEAFADSLAIASEGEETTKIGVEIARMGGNAIDVAAAMSFAISVERPQSTGIGGGGFMIIHFADKKETIAVDFREKAPLTAYEKIFQDAKGDVVPGRSTNGILAGATPGLVAGVLEVHAKYGKLSRQQILAPAIKIAEEGVLVGDHLAMAIKKQADVLKLYPASTAIFFNKKGEPLVAADTLVQKDLGKTLRAISARGRDGFYKGWVAAAILTEEKRLKGILTQKDLDEYNVVFRKPVEAQWDNYTIVSMPPPSSGGTHVIQILNMLKEKDLTAGILAPTSIHYTASAMQMAFADRARYLGDPDFVNVPVKGLTSKVYAKELMSQVVDDKARPSQAVKAGKPPFYESTDTTHFSVMDAAGNTVSSTQTINGFMGSSVVIPGAGFLMNNEMDDFSAKPGVANMFGAIGGKENAVAAGKRPLSSMSPTIVFKDGKPILAVGSPSGTRIISCVTLTVLNYLQYQKPLYDSVAALRYHHQWAPDQIMVEPPGFAPDTQASLEKMGYKINLEGLGCRVQAVAHEGAKLHAVSDPRTAGRALGL